MTTPVLTTKNQSAGVKMDMTTPVLTTKVLWLPFHGFGEYLIYNLYLIYFYMHCQQVLCNIFFI